MEEHFCGVLSPVLHQVWRPWYGPKPKWSNLAGFHCDQHSSSCLVAAIQGEMRLQSFPQRRALLLLKTLWEISQGTILVSARLSDWPRYFFLSFFQIPYKTVCAYGVIGEMLCAICRDEHASCLIVGTRGHGTIRRTILGSISEYVVKHNDVAVVVVPKTHY